MNPSLFDATERPAAPRTDAEAEREARALVALSLTPGVGPGRIRLLVERFGTARAVKAARSSELAAVPGIGGATAQAITAFDDDAQVDQQFEAAQRIGARFVSAYDADFPAPLHTIHDTPAFLWTVGEMLPTDARALAVVGTRKADEAGKRAAYRFAREAAEAGWTIVSGLAYGVDTQAHQGALDGGGRTIAILGSGADRIYPSRNTRLAAQIAERGAVVSEYAMGTKPDGPNFPRRNRIVSGLARGVLVAQATEKGGALITARVAVEQNREVFALPWPFDSETGRGTNRLIQRGHAKLVVELDDLLVELGEPVQGAEAKPEPRLSGVRQTLYAALSASPVHIDALCDATGVEVSTALITLLELEFAGHVRQLAGKQFARA
jgi:DNA processing protein